PLEQGGAFPRRAMPPLLAAGLRVGAELLQVRLVLLPAEVAHMRVTQEKRPLLLRQALDVGRAIWMLGGGRAPRAERAGIAGITQRLEHGVVTQRHPVDGSGMRASTDPAWKEQPLRAEVLDGGPGGARPLEGGE